MTFFHCDNLNASVLGLDGLCWHYFGGEMVLLRNENKTEKIGRVSEKIGKHSDLNKRISRPSGK